MAKVNGLQWVCAVIVFCAVTVTISPAQSFTSLTSFNGSDGMSPQRMALIQGSDGKFYGTTELGGVSGASCQTGSGCGTIFQITPEGNLTTVYNFCTLIGCADGLEPQAPLVQGIDGRFYGESAGSGPDGCGTVFAITAKGQLTTLHTFNLPDGCAPIGGLIQAANGKFYGTTAGGGTQRDGTIFEMSAAGALTTLYSFCSLPNCADGIYPLAPLVQGTDGNFYGVTSTGGGGGNCIPSFFETGCGTLFKITPAGHFTLLYSFCSMNGCKDGSLPSSLIQGTNGNLYGTTSAAGANCGFYGCGTLFEVSRNHLSPLYEFCNLANCADGSKPVSLMQGSDGNFYGTTADGGTGNPSYGTMFKFTSEGTLTTLYSFCSVTSCADGNSPGELLQATNGIFYGTTAQGGTSNDGTVFSLNIGLAPFVSFIRNPAKIGQQFGILGYGLTGTSIVSLNGVPASFTVKSDTLMTATVPTGATTGYVTVTTPSGTLTSNVPFHVLP